MNGTRFEIRENRAPKFGAPAWAGEWPVLVDGTEVAEIIETEHGYRLRKSGVWATPERPYRSSAEDDARNVLLAWRCTDGHPASEMRHEETEINGSVWARVTVEGMVTDGPDSNTEGVYAEYNRRYTAFTEELEKNA